MQRPDASRGSLVAVATVLVVVLLGAIVVLAPPGKAPAPPVRAGLLEMMSGGPIPGLWRVATIDSVHTYAVAAAPGDDACVLVAMEDEDGALGQARRWPRTFAAAFFAPGEPDLFFANYRLVDEPVREGDTMASVWIPRHEYGGDTARYVWTEIDTGAVVRLEDRSYLGYCIRCMERQGPAPELQAAASPAGGGCGGESDAPLPLGQLAGRTPFDLLAPTYLPPGFALVQSGYTSSGDVRMAYLTYSDGLARIALGVASPADMDAFETAQARIPHNPDACPALPKEGGVVDTGGVRIRRRYDRCRTVLRLDALPGVSVSLIARNELPVDEYVDVLASVQPVPKD